MGTQVLLKNKKKKKGISTYDPRPFTVTEIVGRQAVLERGDTVLRRETQKFKKFYPKQEQHQQEEDGWEESQKVWRDKPSEASRLEGPAATSNRSVENATEILAAPVVETLTRHDAETVTTQDNLLTETATETAATTAPRRTTRSLAPPNRYGSWVTK